MFEDVYLWIKALHVIAVISWMAGMLYLAMSGVHGFFSRWCKDFAADRRPRSQKFYRIINEVPTVLMILIVIMVIVKPF
jgi:uncharacterized membrane protein